MAQLSPLPKVCRSDHYLRVSDRTQSPVRNTSLLGICEWERPCCPAYAAASLPERMHNILILWKSGGSWQL